ncbi:MAG TPA: hypothetical protein VMU66_00670, partial [Gaiellales bacterium]|nr:hypothetical protein [Gaiellales bacterium]
APPASAPLAVRVVPVSGNPSAVAFGGGRLWVAAGDRLLRVNAGSLQISQTRFVGVCQDSQVAFGLGAVWLTTGTCGPGAVYRVDPASLAATPAARISAYVEGVAVWRGRVWLGALWGGVHWSLVGIDPVPGRPGSESGPETVGLGTLVAAPGGLWAETGDGGLSRLRPDTAGRLATAPARSVGLSALAFGGSQLWVASSDGRVFRRAGPGGRLVQVAALPFPVTALAVGGRYLWAACYSSRRIARIGPIA